MKGSFFKLAISEKALLFICGMISAVLFFGISLKIFSDVDTAWDSWYYHFPFAARLWGIVPAEQYQWEPFLGNVYRGFPLLGEWVQGFFWKITGQMHAAALPSLFSLVILILLLNKLLQIPRAILAAAFLAIPLIQAHVITAYVDLPANIFATIGMVCAFLEWVEPQKSKQRYYCALISFALAANTKYQVLPVVTAAWLLLMVRRFLLSSDQGDKSGEKHRLIFEVIVSAGVIFFVPLKNYFLFGHPLYPVNLQALAPPMGTFWDLDPSLPLWKRTLNGAGIWFLSVTDATRYPYERFITHGYDVPWEVAMGSLFPLAHRMGGYNGPYVIFLVLNLMVVGWFSDKKKFRAVFYSFLALTLITAAAPVSFELRYYFYWILMLIVANLYLIYRSIPAEHLFSGVMKKTFFLVTISALLFVLILSRGMHVQPLGISTQKALQYFRLNKAWLDDMESKGGGCVLQREPANFMYAHYFHPQRKSYIVISATKPEECAVRPGRI